MQNLLLVLRKLSLDIVTGAMVGAWLIATACDVIVEWHTLLLLGSTVWLIYAFDHMIDAFKSRHQKGRHHFYYKYRRYLILISVLFAGMNIVLLTLQNQVLILYGVQMSFLILIYLLLSNVSTTFNRCFKELSCAVLYAGGISLPAAAGGELSLTLVVIFAFYTASAWINLLTISYFEMDYDRQAGFLSLPQTIGAKQVMRLVYSLYLLSLVILSLSVISGLITVRIGVALLSILVIQSLVSLSPKHFSQKDRYRAISDFAYLLPIILLFGE